MSALRVSRTGLPFSQLSATASSSLCASIASAIALSTSARSVADFSPQDVLDRVRGVQREFDVLGSRVGDLGDRLRGRRAQVDPVLAVGRRVPLAADEVLIARLDRHDAAGLTWRDVLHAVAPSQMTNRGRPREASRRYGTGLMAQVPPPTQRRTPNPCQCRRSYRCTAAALGDRTMWRTVEGPRIPFWDGQVVLLTVIHCQPCVPGPHARGGCSKHFRQVHSAH